MKFKVLNAHKDKGVLLVSGCFVPEKGGKCYVMGEDNKMHYEDEKDVLSQITTVLEEQSTRADGSLMSLNFVSNSHTILMKSVPIDTAFSMLHLQNDSFNLHLKVVMGKNMQSNSLKPEIEQYFRVHKL